VAYKEIMSILGSAEKMIEILRKELAKPVKKYGIK
jgi:hypothetical protein